MSHRGQQRCSTENVKADLKEEISFFINSYNFLIGNHFLSKISKVNLMIN